MRKYHPELTDRIMPIVSPMVATALAVKKRYGQHVRCVFIGPCVAKKAEILDPEIVGVVDEVLTLVELERVLTARGIDPALAPPSDFDPPYAGKARIYPVPGGMLESAGIGDGILDPRLIVVSGKDETVETLAGLSDELETAPCWSRPSCARAATPARESDSDEPGMIRRRRVAEFAAESLTPPGRGHPPRVRRRTRRRCL